jgi:hypothetical protein
MKNLIYILIIFFISTSYLFPQDVINEEIDISNSFYKDYLNGTYFVYSTRNIITETDGDTSAIKKEKIGVILTEPLTSNNKISPSLLAPIISLSIKFPISGRFHIIIKDWIQFSESIHQSYHLPLLMVGYYGVLDEDKKYIGEIAVGFGMGGLSLAVPININVYYRIYKNALLSFDIDYVPYGYDSGVAGTLVIFSLGLGIAY